MQVTALNERVRVVCGPVNVGIIQVSPHQAVLIDSGLDRRSGRRLLELCADDGLDIIAILNTHAHADHIGGNAFINRAVNCRILASDREAPAITHPEIQAIALFGGAPPPELFNPQLTAEPTVCEVFPGQILQFGDQTIEVLDLAGHSIGQVGFRVGDVIFYADTLFPPALLQKHRLVYLYDPIGQLECLRRLRTIQAAWFVGGHIPPSHTIATTIAENIGHVESVLQHLRGLLAIPQPLDRLVKSFLGHYGIKQGGWQHFLYRATLNGYLSALRRMKEADFRVLDNLLIWYLTPPESPEPQP